MQTYWEMFPAASSRLVQFPELRQGLSAHVVEGLLQLLPVYPGGQVQLVEEVEVSKSGKQTPPFTHSEGPEQRSTGESRSARLFQL